MTKAERADVMEEARELSHGGYDREFAEAELRRFFPQAHLQGLIDSVLRRYYDRADEAAA